MKVLACSIVVKTLSDAREFVYSSPSLYDWRRVLRDSTFWGEGLAALDNPRCACPDVRMYLIDHCVRAGWHPYSDLRVERRGGALGFTPTGTFVARTWAGQGTWHREAAE